MAEGSFADAANNHGFKRARWRRLWRQQIQDYLIAAIQNIRILLSRAILQPAARTAGALCEVAGGISLASFTALLNIPKAQLRSN